MSLGSSILLFLLLLETCALLYIFFQSKRKEVPCIKQKNEEVQKTNTEICTNQYAPNHRTILLAGRLASAAEMIPTAVHDIRQPLSVLCGYLDLLTLQDSINPEIKDYLQTCSESTMRMESYVSKLREYARYDKEYTLVPIKLIPHIERAEELLSEPIQKLHITITKDYSAEDPEVLFATQDCILLFHHLLSNAVDAVRTVADPQLEFRIRSDKDNVIFTMKDNGCGITEDVLQNCFTPLYTTKEWGTGLGLPFCSAVMQNIGGTIEIIPNDNDVPGCCIRLTFPKHGGN